MHLKYAFDTMELDELTIAVPVGESVSQFRGVIKLNETSAFILELLKYEISEEEIVNALEKEYDAPRELIIEDVRRYISEFEKRGLLT